MRIRRRLCNRVYLRLNHQWLARLQNAHPRLGRAERGGGGELGGGAVVLEDQVVLDGTTGEGVA